MLEIVSLNNFPRLWTNAQKDWITLWHRVGKETVVLVSQAEK